MKEEEKELKKIDEAEELDISRDQAQIVSMLRIQNLESLLVNKGLLTQEELVASFESLNNNFVNQLIDFTKTRRESK